MIESFLTVGRQIITLYLLMAVGYVLGKLKLIDDHGAASMSTLVMYIVSPCMLLVAFQIRSTTFMSWWLCPSCCMWLSLYCPV